RIFGGDQITTSELDPDSDAYEVIQQLKARMRRNNIMSHFIEKADQALYAAKLLGRDRTVFNMDEREGDDDLLVDLKTGDIYVHDMEIQDGNPVAKYDRIES